ncbi:Protein RRP5 homolog [Strongyloides ratti]|uniref:Protein RRP5 homolog n=1 Tax=Strongyloides ratti TaxID=34506 RepID=A0A090LFW7_STRRB|nr:Protein RRP5 homolog [Strongyloides ratti]CEF68652.1 Protein RRP5 homolog [Strongyloides ratti]
MFGEEPSFPRSKGDTTDSNNTNRPQKRKFPRKSEVKNKSNQKVDKFLDDEQKKKNLYIKEKEEHSLVWKKQFCLSYATPGVLCLAVVKEIRELYVLLETSNSVKLKLPANMISYQFAKASTNEEISLSSIVTKGQMLVVKVVKGIEEGAKTNEITVTCIPKQVNSHVVSGNINIGTVLVGVLDKLEDKGAIIDLGLSSGSKGFVPYNSLPSFVDSSKLHLGQPFLFSVTQCSSRIIQLTGYIEGNVPSPEVAMHFDKDKLFPGMVIMCSPDDFTNTGVYTNFGNNVKGFIDKYAMPPRFREDLSTFKKPIKGVITISKPSSPMLIINCNPDIVAISKPEKRLVFDGYKIGDTIECVVKDILNVGYSLDLPVKEDGKPCLTNAFLKENYGGNCEKLKVGDKILVRVINYKIFDKCLVVTNKPEVMKQKIMSLENVVPGKLIVATVRGVTDSCVRLKISDTVRGTIPKIHATDRQVKNWQQKFVVGNMLRVRPLFIDEDSDNVICTAKPTLLQSTYPPVTSVDKKYCDMITHGYIIKQLPNGYLISFYNRVIAFMPNKYAETLTQTSIGSPVKVRIMNVDVEKKKVIVCPSHINPVDHTKENSNNEKKEKQTKKSSNYKIKIYTTYEAVVKGPWNHEAGNPSCSIELILPEGNIGRLHASELDLSNYKLYDNPVSMFLQENTGKSIRVKVIEMKNLMLSTNSENTKKKDNPVKHVEKFKIAECTLKKHKIELGRKSGKLLNYAKKFKVGSIVRCFVTKVTNPKSLYVEINPYVKGFIAREVLKDISKDDGKEYEEGMFIEGKITSISKARTYPTLQLANLEDLTIGINQEVTGKILSVKTCPLRILVSLPGQQLGVLRLFGISTDFKEALELFKEFEVNDCFTFKVISYNKTKESWNLISKLVSDTIANNPSLAEKIYFSRRKIPFETEMIGHVISIKDNSCLVDISPSVTGSMTITENDKIHINDIIKCATVKGKKDEMLKLKYVSTIFDGSLIKIDNSEIEDKSKFEDVNSGHNSTNDTVMDEDIPVTVVTSDSELRNPDENIFNDSSDGESETEESDKKLKNKKREKEKFDNNNEEEIEEEEDEDDEEAEENDEGEEEDDEEEEEVVVRKKPKIDLAKEIKNLSETEKEKIIFERQEQINENNMEINNEDDFERLLTGSPNESMLWINYIGFYLANENIEKAREIAERALKTINYMMEDELYNIWVAYLNMESKLGDENRIKKIYERAANNVNEYKISMQYIKILRNATLYDLLEHHIEKFLKKYGHTEPEIWYIYAEHLYFVEKAELARELQKRACFSLPKKMHVDVLCKFAQLEYKLCDQEQGKTMFEKIVQVYKQRTDVWNVYLDLVIKNESPKTTRDLFEEIIKIPFGPKKLKPFFKKWIKYEEKHGDYKSQKYVHEKAQEIVNDSMVNLGLI